ncbi:S66 peptidase family protein [Microbulbifer sp. THAF38]|uniref:S66 family peptidase n=1 Tax=Microbulbifer sp. THAF38 TaxID=2587856 RepID=UPI001268A425|nr:S66 peptidase family protein [Microbulbifer sp. THAF38]QFT56160.1 Microcin C7 self-immunity protein MccF [Microbulbifer sp. THAF38]
MTIAFRPRLTPGKAIAVFSPSSNAASKYPIRLQQGIKSLGAALNVEVVLPAQVTYSTGFTAGSAAQRTQVLEDLLLDDSVTAIICAIGGFNSAEILEHLDAEVVRRHPKVVVGNSDASALLLGIYAMGGWITYFGPAVLPQFGEYPDPFPFTVHNLQAVISNETDLTELGDPRAWTQEFADWGKNPRQRHLKTEGSQRTVYRTGSGSGILFGGNIETLNMLIGTPYLKVPMDSIFFWEAHAEEARLERVRRALTHLRQSGVFSHVRAMLIGRSPRCTEVAGLTLKDIVLEACEDYDFPIIANLSFGHTDPILTLPIGAEAYVVAEQREEARITLV